MTENNIIRGIFSDIYLYHNMANILQKIQIECLLYITSEKIHYMYKIELKIIVFQI